MGHINSGNLVQIDDKVYFNDGENIVNFNTSTNSDSLLNCEKLKRTDDQSVSYLLKQYKSNNLWVASIHDDLLVPFNLSENQLSNNILYKRLKNEGILSVFTESNGNTWFGGVKGITCVQQFNYSRFIDSKPNLFIGKVIINNRDTSLSNNENYFLYNQKYKELI